MADSSNQQDMAGGRRGAYRVLARKYRPASFDDLIGQAPMVTTLTNAFRNGRIAQAFMLTGVRGVGKTTTARILARALNYRRGEIDAPTIDVREEGEHCRAILEGRHVDVIEMDAASHTGIDDIRELIESAQYAPAIARYKVYIIDEVHMLSRSAFNGLLKTLEEPPAHLKFVFATTEIRKVPVTVLSRCQRFDLRRIESSELVRHLRAIGEKEGVEADDEALAMIARAAEGSVRDALSLFDQAIAHGSGENGAAALDAQAVRAMLGLADRARVIELFDHVMKGDVAAALSEMKAQYDQGADPAVVLEDLAAFVHRVTRLKYVPESATDPALSEAERRRGAEFAAALSVRALGRAWQILLKGVGEVSASEHPLAAADMVLVRLAHASTLPWPEDLLRIAADGERDGNANRPGAAPTRGGQAPQPRMHAGGGAIAQGAPPRLVASQSSVSQGAPTSPQAAAGRQPSARAHEPVEQISVSRFEELVLLAEDRRDLQMRTALRRNVRVVSFADGRLEINIVGSPPANFLRELSARLTSWTGRKWFVATSREGGAPTIEESEQAEARSKEDDARADPAVAAILSRFPGSRVIDVRLRGAAAGDGAVGADAGEPLPAVLPGEDEDSL